MVRAPACVIRYTRKNIRTMGAFTMCMSGSVCVEVHGRQEECNEDGSSYVCRPCELGVNVEHLAHMAGMTIQRVLQRI